MTGPLITGHAGFRSERPSHLGAGGGNGSVGLKFNPPPGWPLPWDFEPPPGWEPDPDWPEPPPGWPLWIGSEAPRVLYQVPAGRDYVPGYMRESLVIQQPAKRRLRTPRAVRRPPRRPTRARGGHRRRPRRPSVGGRVALVIVGLVAAAFAGLELVGVAIKYQSGVSKTGGDGHTGRVSLLSLRTGACFQDPAYRHPVGRVPSDVTPVPCTQVHSAQIYARFSAAGGPTYPGRTALLRQGSRECRSVLAARVDGSKLSARFSLINIVPSRARWSSGQRTISCAVVDSTAHLTTSLVKPHGRAKHAPQAARPGVSHRVARGGAGRRRRDKHGRSFSVAGQRRA
jgi:hypothetical protein